MVQVHQRCLCRQLGCLVPLMINLHPISLELQKRRWWWGDQMGQATFNQVLKWWRVQHRKGTARNGLPKVSSYLLGRQLLTTRPLHQDILQAASTEWAMALVWIEEATKVVEALAAALLLEVMAATRAPMMVRARWFALTEEESPMQDPTIHTAASSRSLPSLTLSTARRASWDRMLSSSSS